jgi:hypothetical protein
VALTSLLALAPVVAGCGEEDSCCALPPAADAVVDLGGLPSSWQRLTIGGDGRARLVLEGTGERRRTVAFPVDPEELEGIRAALERVDFGGPVEIDDPECRDCPTVTLVHGFDRYRGQLPSLPPDVEAVSERLQGVIESASPEDSEELPRLGDAEGEDGAEVDEAAGEQPAPEGGDLPERALSQSSLQSVPD